MRQAIKKGKALEEFKRWRHALFQDKEVSVPPLWSAGTEPDTVYPRECFFRAYRYLCDLSSRLPGKVSDGVYLVHGECEFALGPHARVELPGDVVFDGVLQHFYRLSSYGARGWYKYEPYAAHLIAAHVHKVPDANGQYYYEFSVPLKLPWGDPNNPLIIDFDKALELLRTSGLRPDLAKSPKPRKRRLR